jgi:Holliday junction resolvasome RuvABC endonuclease subunit
MKILGLDIATHTGYSVLEDGKLTNYGVIDLPQEMNLFQRLSFFENNLNQILNTHNPDYVAIEDILLGISGVKTLAYLGRLNGVAISCCYKKVQNNIQLMMPSEWKANSFGGLNGTSKKVDVQISVCKHYKLIDEELLSEITKPLDNTNIDLNNVQEKIKQLTLETKKYIAFLSRKRNVPKETDKAAFRKVIDENKETIAQYKKYIQQCNKKVDTIYKNVSLEIMSKCGLTQDVSDSVGVAYSLWKRLNKQI